VVLSRRPEWSPPRRALERAAGHARPALLKQRSRRLSERWQPTSKAVATHSRCGLSEPQPRSIFGLDGELGLIEA
jgi:hypothetical protein